MAIIRIGRVEWRKGIYILPTQATRQDWAHYKRLKEHVRLYLKKKERLERAEKKKESEEQ